MEAPAVTLDLLGVVHRLLTGRTLGSSPPVWHLFREKEKKAAKLCCSLSLTTSPGLKTLIDTYHL